MTHVTGEFASIALPSGSVGPASIRTLPSKEQQQMLTQETKPLEFELNFANEERVAVTLLGSGREPSTIWKVFQALKSLAELSADWDSYGAQPLSPAAVRRSVSLFPLLLPESAPEPSVVPTNDGGLQFEWHRHGVNLEVKVPPSGPVSYFIANAVTGLEMEGVRMPDRRTLAEAFSQMTGSN